jgi:hypothetical protein
MNDIVRARTHSRIWVGAFLIACFGSAALLKRGIVSGWPGWALFAASFLLLIPLVRSAERTQAACGANSVAMRTYNRRMIVASFAYVILLLGGVAVANNFAPPAPVRVLLAIAAALPVMFMIRAMGLLIKEERDEYLRMRLVEQSLIATGFLLATMTLYGFLNAFELAPRLDAYLAVPVWALGLGIGRLFQKDASC